MGVESPWEFGQRVTTLPPAPSHRREGEFYGFAANWGSGHGVGRADARSAAAVARHQAQLVTLNARHFPMVEVEVAYIKSE